MKAGKNILIAFILNFAFSVFEFIGGFYTNSVAIVSDAIHDMGDAISIFISYILEKVSRKKKSDKYTYGYYKYSVIGSIITLTILIIGSIFVLYNSIKRIINPINIDYTGMIIFAIFGFSINLLAAILTRDSKSLNQKAVNLHMLEDVLGWFVVLIGSIIMKFTDIKILDPILSIGVAIYILVSVYPIFKTIMNVFLEKTPDSVSIKDIKITLLDIKGVKDVHHIHVRSLDGVTNVATLHVVSDGKNKNIKKDVKEELLKLSINHSTVEIESENEVCIDKDCE